MLAGGCSTPTGRSPSPSGTARSRHPIIEATELFSRGVGTDTDIVEKQMFSFEDRGGRSLTLRPEGTAGALRAVLGAHLDQEVRPVRVQYAGPFFRAERPQAGRQHQFTQVGIECIGEGSPALDAEIMEVAWRFFQALGITDIQLQVNSLGSPEDRVRYRAALVAYYTPLESSLCDDCRRRLHTNPLRLLDCKRDSRAGRRRSGALGLARRAQAASTSPLCSPSWRRRESTPSATTGWCAGSTTTARPSSSSGTTPCRARRAPSVGEAATTGWPSCSASRPRPATGYALGVERILMVARALGTVPATGAAADVLVCSVEPGTGRGRREHGARAP